ncbi:hypothetical protein M5D96_012251 [Drosophila gunungcola]|uniref:Uncharacterized protein n=1 Tax=Drosophila gunungcola TaxID=103775 RepID=A0A9Q0BKH7_9MUSC|nr:hypothetical protein M5D96_012251 [Drosophila gunungcola]
MFCRRLLPTLNVSLDRADCEWCLHRRFCLRCLLLPLARRGYRD